MQIWGLTGGIASGKTSVARAFAACGVPGVNADALYHGLIAPDASGRPSSLAEQLGAAFPGILGPQGHIDRPALAAQVFADAATRTRLEALTHPAVQEASARAFAALADQGVRHALYDVPLLFERDLARRFAGVVVVWVPEPVQRARLAERDGLSPEACAARLRAQWPLDAKRARATWVVDNSGTRAATRAQVAQICTKMAVYRPPAPL